MGDIKVNVNGKDYDISESKLYAGMQACSQCSKMKKLGAKVYKLQNASGIYCSIGCAKKKAKDKFSGGGGFSWW